MADTLPEILEEFVAANPGLTAREIQKCVVNGMRPLARIQVALIRLVDEGKLGRVPGGQYRHHAYLYYKRIDGDVIAGTEQRTNGGGTSS